MSATIKELVQAEIADFCAGLGSPGEPVTPEQIQIQLMTRIIPLVESASAELSALAAQKPIAYRWEGATGRINYDGIKPIGVPSQPLFTRAAPAFAVVPDEAAAFEAWRYSDRNLSITLADDVYRGVAISAFKAGMAAVIEASGGAK